MSAATPVTANSIRERLRTDKARLREVLAADGAQPGCLWLLPSWQAVCAYKRTKIPLIMPEITAIMVPRVL